MSLSYPYLPYETSLVEKARSNRMNPTPAERRMWYEMLGNREFENLKFTRQKPIDRYIVDFYCAELMLAIEIDGESHASQMEYDSERTRRLSSLGVTVIRYGNSDIMNNLSGVYEDLMVRVKGIRDKGNPRRPLIRGPS